MEDQRLQAPDWSKLCPLRHSAQILSSRLAFLQQTPQRDLLLLQLPPWSLPPLLVVCWMHWPSLQAQPWSQQLPATGASPLEQVRHCPFLELKVSQKGLASWQTPAELGKVPRGQVMQGKSALLPAQNWQIPALISYLGAHSMHWQKMLILRQLSGRKTHCWLMKTCVAGLQAEGSTIQTPLTAVCPAPQMGLRAQEPLERQQPGLHWVQALEVKLQSWQLMRLACLMHTPCVRRLPLAHVLQVSKVRLKSRQFAGSVRHLAALAEQYSPLPQFTGRHWPEERQQAAVMQVQHSPVVWLNVPQVRLTQTVPTMVSPVLHWVEGTTHCPFWRVYWVPLRQVRQAPVEASNWSQVGLTSQQSPKWKYWRALQRVLAKQRPWARVKPFMQPRQAWAEKSQFTQGRPLGEGLAFSDLQPVNTLLMSAKAAEQGQGQLSEAVETVTVAVGAVVTTTPQQPEARGMLQVATELAMEVGMSWMEEATRELTGPPAISRRLMQLLAGGLSAGLRVRVTVCLWSMQNSLATCCLMMSVTLRMFWLLTAAMRQQRMNWLYSWVALDDSARRLQTAVSVTVQFSVHDDPAQPVKVKIVFTLVESMMLRLRLEAAPPQGRLRMTVSLAFLVSVPSEQDGISYLLLASAEQEKGKVEREAASTSNERRAATFGIPSFKIIIWQSSIFQIYSATFRYLHPAGGHQLWKLNAHPLLTSKFCGKITAQKPMMILFNSPVIYLFKALVEEASKLSLK